MRKFFCFFVLFTFASILVFSQNVNILDYFPSKIGNSWTYANSSGRTVDIRTIRNVSERNGIMVYLMENESPGIGTTSTLFGNMNNRIVILVTRNILGQARENQPPMPILATIGQEWRYNARGDDIRFSTSRASCTVDEKIYNDCILVEEKIFHGNELIMIRKNYYARGIGLVLLTLQMSGEAESIYNKLINYKIN